jgi:hypothetical protein
MIEFRLKRRDRQVLKITIVIQKTTLMRKANLVFTLKYTDSRALTVIFAVDLQYHFKQRTTYPKQLDDPRISSLE